MIVSMADTIVSVSALKLGGVIAVIASCAWWLASTFLLQGRRENHKDKPIPAARPLFKSPLPQALEDFDLDSANPHAYRPFRHGPSFVTIGIRRMNFNNWIEMDSNFLSYHDLKISELEMDRDAHVAFVDNAVTRDACFEMLEELTQFLTHRYPKIFQLTGNCVRNTVTGEAFQYPAPNPTEALSTAAKLVQDDLVLMIENNDGEYHIDAAAVCLPGFWRLKEKFRMSLDTLHFEANVPHYGAKLQKPMNRFFKNLTPEKPVIRNNFFIQLDDGLHWSHRMGKQAGEEVASWATANSRGLKLEEIHFRSERQSLRRLPRSRALIFTIRTYFEPITTIAKEPHVPGRLAEAIRQWDADVSAYKGREHWEDVLLPYLDEQHRIQVESGVLEKPEVEYPY